MNTKKCRSATLCTIIASVLISLFTGLATIEAAPMDAGADWSVSLGREADFGPGRDPGDRDDGMFGVMAGTSLGAQVWLQDWLALGGSLVYQTDTSRASRYNYSSDAVRAMASLRLALPTRVSPHVSVGVGYDRFRRYWSLIDEAGEAIGQGTDGLDSVVASAEGGLSVGFGKWSIGAHASFVSPLFTDAHTQITAWQGQRTANTSASRSQAMVTDWAHNGGWSGTINIGLRVARSF